MRGLTHDAKKWAKKSLVRLMSLHSAPNAFKRFASSLMGIEFEGLSDPKQQLFAARFMNGCKSALCISIDFDNRSQGMRDTSIEATIQLNELFDEFAIPVTWAICGATALSESDAFRSIVRSRIKHELAIHTFDHVDFSLPDLSDGIASAQIKRNVQVLPAASRPRTFIFPWNREGHFDILKREGFIAFRGRKRRLAYPSKRNELWDIHPVFYLSEKNYGHADVLKAFLNLTIAHCLVLHLWFHPWNLDSDGNVKDYLSRTLRPFLDYTRLKMVSGELWVCTMGDLANYCELRSRLRIWDFEKGTDSISARLECAVEDERFDRKQPLTIGIRVPDPTRLPKVLLEGRVIRDCDVIQPRALEQEGLFFVRVSFENPVRHLHTVFLAPD